MFNTLIAIKTYAQSFIQDQKGVVAFEYLLVLAGITVAVIFAVAFAAPGLIDAVIGATCAGMNTILPAGALGAGAIDCATLID